MYWLWKWLKSNNNCTLSTWKDKFLFNLLFCIPNSFCTFHDYARGGTPFLASPDGPSLIFYHSDFWTTLLLWEKSVALKLFTVLKYFISFRTFEQLVACPEKQCALNSRVEYIYFWSFRILNNLRMPWKIEFALKFFTALKYFYLSGFLRNLRLPWKQSLWWNFSLYLTYFLHSVCLSNFACPEKQSVPWIHCIECILYPSEFWTTCACPEKQSLPRKCSLHWNNDFWGTCACSDNRVFLKIFTVLNIVFTFSISEQLVLALKNRVCPEFTVLNIYLLSFRILNNLRLPWKTETALKIFTVLKYFLSFRIVEQLELALKTEFALSLSTPALPPCTPLGASTKDGIFAKSPRCDKGTYPG